VEKSTPVAEDAYAKAEPVATEVRHLSYITLLSVKNQKFGFQEQALGFLTSLQTHNVQAWKKAQVLGEQAKPYVVQLWQGAKPLAAKAVEASKPLLREAQLKASDLLQQAQERSKS
jgi:hypothetical protein